MAYQLTAFDEIEFRGIHPFVLNPSQDHSPVGADSALVDSIGGFFDRFGSDDARATRQPISITHLILGETAYLVDNLGNHIVDNNGNRIIAGNEAQILRAQLVALREKVRKRGTLWRTRLDDETVREWKTARLLRMGQPQRVRDRKNMATVTLDFESPMAFWHAEDATTFSTSVSDGTTAYLVVENPGETVNDAVVTVTRTSGTVTAVQVTCTDLGINWVWSGSLGSGESLVVDEGEQGIAEGGVAAYSGFSVAGSQPGWMNIQRGSWVFQITVTGGTANFELSMYNQFA